MSTSLPASPHARLNGPALLVVLLGVVVGGAAVFALPLAYADAAFGVLAAALALYCALQASGTARLAVGAATLLSVYSTPLLISSFASRIAGSNDSWLGLLLMGVCAALLVQLYLYLAARAFPLAPAEPATGRSVRRWRQLLAATALVNVAVSGLPLAHELLPCSALDVVRRLGGCRVLLHVPGSERVVAVAPDGTAAATVASIVEPWDQLARRSTAELLAEPQRVAVWKLQTGARLQTLAHPARIIDTALSRDGSLVVTSAGDGRVRIWRVADSGLSSAVEVGAAVSALALSPNSAVLATVGDEDGAPIQLWRVRDGVLLRELPVADGVHALLFSPDSALLAVQKSWGVELWRVADGTRLHELSKEQIALASGASLAWSPDGTMIVAVGKSRVPDAAEPDGHTLAATVELWDVRSGRALLRRTAAELLHASGDTWLGGVAFSPDGARLALGANTIGVREDTLLILRVADGAVLARLDGLIDVDEPRFAADGAAVDLVDGSTVVRQTLPESALDVQPAP